MKLLTKYRSEIMGICIIWIMLFHSGIEAPDSTLLRAIWYLFVSFGGGIGVDIFLICSGFGLRCSQLKNSASGKEEHVLSFYKRRAERLLPAYVIVAVLYYAILCKSVGGIIYNVFFLNFFIDGKRDFWYILASIVLYLLFPLYGNAVKKIGYRFSAFQFIVFSVGFTLLILWLFPSLYKLWEILLWRLPCFWIGCYFGDLLFHNNNREFSVAIVGMTVAGLVLLCFFGLISAPGAILRNEFTLLSPVIILAFCSVFEITKINDSGLYSVLSYLGTISLELYVIHVSLGGYFAKQVGKWAGSFVVRLTVYFVISILMAAVLHIVLDKLFKKRKAVVK